MSNATISPIGRKYLRLSLCPDIGPIRLANMLRELGGIDAVLSAGVDRLMGVEQIGRKSAASIAQYRDTIDIEAEIALAEKHGVRIRCLADEDYPALLRNTTDPPSCLYMRGEIQREDALALAIVGSRRCTHYGQEQAERFAALAANAGLTIVSGMARGIDTHAHRGALAAGGRTIAVLGCGLSHMHTAGDIDFVERIMKNGAIVSGLPMAVAPDAKNFPPRNRIIAGLSLGTLVIEAGTRSGALITARLAAEYDREVFAVPGRVDSPLSQGCHALIKAAAAKLVTTLPDVLEELGEAGQVLLEDHRELADAPPPPATTIANLDARERAVLETLGGDPASLNELCDVCDMPPEQVAAVITTMQLKGVVKRIPPDKYQRCAVRS